VPPFTVVWFKRDLRVDDHQPLADAAAAGPVLALYVHEPCVVRSAEYEEQHHTYIAAALRELGDGLARRGARLLVCSGDVVQALAELRERLGPFALRSHEETGLLATFARDRAVARWCRETGTPWIETPQTGVVRRLATRDGWARQWNARMHAPLAAARAALASPQGAERIESPRAASPRELGVAPTLRTTLLEPAGEAAAARVLDDFLHARGRDYRRAMSAPGPAWAGCSRLSEHLAFGTISMRRVVHDTEARIDALRGDRSREAGAWRASLGAFAQRLRWHCHFMQKLEDMPDLEERNTARMFDGMREREFDAARFDAWKAGMTGFPMVDACMRSLVATGWLNFRMRAMLVSFASYDLWLHWREPAQWLGARFLDFEPGIHYAQFQMQSGVTGINTLRMYSPAKQARDHDPDGAFIRRWVPELQDLPTEYLAQPETAPIHTQMAAGCVVGRDYPAPLVDHAAATREARRRIVERRRTAEGRAESAAILEKHGSRRRPARRRAPNDQTRAAAESAQLDLLDDDA
jgi:deoxyribodipyrimidine photo-lyase